MLRRIERWSAHEGIEIRLTGVDLNPHAIRAAREFSPRCQPHSLGRGRSGLTERKGWGNRCRHQFPVYAPSQR